MRRSHIMMKIYLSPHVTTNRTPLYSGSNQKGELKGCHNGTNQGSIQSHASMSPKYLGSAQDVYYSFNKTHTTIAPGTRSDYTIIRHNKTSQRTQDNPWNVQKHQIILKMTVTTKLTYEDE